MDKWEELKDATVNRDVYARLIADAVSQGATPQPDYIAEYQAHRDRVHYLRWELLQREPEAM